MNPQTRHSIRRPVCVLLAALTVRAVYLAFFLNSPLSGVYLVDQLYYRTWGLEIAGGGLIGTGPFEQAPLYAYLLGIYYRLFGPLDLGILVIQLLAGTVTVLLIMWIAGRLFDRRTAFITGVIAAVYGPLVFYECMVMKTFLEPLLVISALAAAIRASSSLALRWPVVAGFAVGLACLVREVYILLLVPMLLALWLGEGVGRHRRLVSVLALVAAFGIAVAPAVVHNRLTGSNFMGVSVIGGENFYTGFGPEATGFYVIPLFLGPYPYIEHQDFRDEAFLRTGRPHSPGASSRYWFRETLNHIRAQPSVAARLFIRKAAILFADFELPDSENFMATRGYIPLLRALPTFGWIVGLGFLGLALAAVRPRQNLLPLGFAAALSAVILLTFNFGRYRVALVAIWLLFAGRGATWLWEVLVRPGDRRNVGLAALAAVIVTSAFSFLPPLGLDLAQRDRELDRFREEIVRDALIQQSIPQLRGRVAADPGNPKLLLELGRGLERLGRLPEAIGMYQAALRKDPAHTEALLLHADLLVRMNQPERATASARALALQGLSRESLFGRYLLGCIALLEASNAPSIAAARPALARAIGELKVLAALQPEDAQVRLKLARAYHLAGDRAAAQVELRTALAIDPKSKEGNSLAKTIFH
jgi:tetratricopeptide (TPR) repeat protein